MPTEFKTAQDVLAGLPDDRSARDYFQYVRWKSGVFCPFCRKRQMTNAMSNVRRCTNCNKRFTAVTGTIFEDTRIPLRKWIAAIRAITLQDGTSVKPLMRDLRVTETTARFVLQRLRDAARTRTFNLSVVSDSTENISIIRRG
jgi:transposase-like protein